MAKSQKCWARKKRRYLIRLLGGKCSNEKCGTRSMLEFDCIVTQSDGHGKLDTSARMSYYMKQLRNNNLQLLCETCNRVKSRKVIDYRSFELKFNLQKHGFIS